MQHTGNTRVAESPVVIRVVCIVAAFNPLCKKPQLASVQPKSLDKATRGEEVEGKQCQKVCRGSLSVCKDIKLPIALSILQSQHDNDDYSLNACLAAR